MLLEEFDNQLKPCPLCGNNVHVVEWSHIFNQIYTHIQCPICELELRHTQYFEEVYQLNKTQPILLKVNEDAITTWNKRVKEE